MRKIFATLLVAPLIAVVPTPAAAATCVNMAEFGNVEQGHTRNHVEVDIFDDYSGALVDAWTADGHNWRYKAYALCGEGAVSIVYKRDAGTSEPFRVHSKAS